MGWRTVLAKRPTVEDRMRTLRDHLQQLSGDELLAAIREALGDPSNIVCEMAAKAVLEHEPGNCLEQLRSAYDRFLVEPDKRDKNCRAKLPIVEALNQQRYDDIDFYTLGMKYVQMEPAYGAEGGYEDTAAHVRGTHAFGLINCPLASPDDTLHALIDLLHDKEWTAREHAARALSLIGSRAAAAVLRMKVLSGDRQSPVIGACFSGLVRSDRERFLEFVAGFLNHKNLDLAIEAGLALGESRTDVGAECLIDAIHAAWTIELRHSHMMSLGLSRRENAIDYLIQRIGEPDVENAKVAIAALAPNRFDESIRERVLRAVNDARDRKLSQTFAEHF